MVYSSLSLEKAKLFNMQFSMLNHFLECIYHAAYTQLKPRDSCLNMALDTPPKPSAMQTMTKKCFPLLHSTSTRTAQKRNWNYLIVWSFHQSIPSNQSQEQSRCISWRKRECMRVYFGTVSWSPAPGCRGQGVSKGSSWWHSASVVTRSLMGCALSFISR